MAEKLLLVDFENVQQVDFSHLDKTYKAIIFHGTNQKSVSIELIKGASKFGIQLDFQKIEGNGKNALDFHIAMQLGRILEKSSKQECIILSKDKGFDPLIKHLNKEGLNCHRINSLLELDRKPVGDDPNYLRVLEVLRKTPKRNLPQKETYPKKKPTSKTK